MIAGALLVVVLTAAYAAILYWADRYEKEPGSALAAALLGGAVAAPALAVAIERLAGIRWSVFPASFQGLNAQFFGGPNLAGALVEEGAKALVVLVLFARLPREFDGVLDGVVYGALVGAGFSVAELAVYLWDLSRVGAAVQVGTGLFLGILLTGLTHAGFTGLFGAGLGTVREFRLTGAAAWWAAVGGFGVAALYHAAYEALAALAAQGVSVAAWARLLADWLGVLALVVVVAWAQRRERTVLLTYLPAEVQGGEVPREYWEAVQSGRWGSLPRAVRQNLAELAFARRRLERGLADESELRRYRENLRKVTG